MEEENVLEVLGAASIVAADIKTFFDPPTDLTSLTLGRDVLLQRSFCECPVRQCASSRSWLIPPTLHRLLLVTPWPGQSVKLFAPASGVDTASVMNPALRHERHAVGDSN